MVDAIIFFGGSILIFIVLALNSKGPIDSINQTFNNMHW